MSIEPSQDAEIRVLALCGGIGGAKLALGLAHVVPPGRLAVLVNTGDDFEHLGLHIAPDLDTVLYTLAGVANPETGWGRAGETWQFMESLARLGGETWFRLGDRDLAVHVERTRRLRTGEPLSAVTADFAARFGLTTRLWPMSDDPVRTWVRLADGARLAFQPYFVREQCRPVVAGFDYVGAEAARPFDRALALLEGGALEAVVICPSNPWLSVAPLLAMPTLRLALARTNAPVVAVSPLVGGRAIKGPTAKIMAELGIAQTVGSIARFYAGVIDGLVIDEVDGDALPGLPVPARATRTVMASLDDRCRLARNVLALAGELAATAPDRGTDPP